MLPSSAVAAGFSPEVASHKLQLRLLLWPHVALFFFGLSRALVYSNLNLKTSSYGRLKGTCRWMAYELAKSIENVNQEIIFTKASDMWAYGMILYV